MQVLILAGNQNTDAARCCTSARCCIGIHGQGRVLSDMLTVGKVSQVAAPRTLSFQHQFLDVFQRSATYTRPLYSSSQPSSAQPAHSDRQVHGLHRKQAEAAHTQQALLPESALLAM